MRSLPQSSCITFVPGGCAATTDLWTEEATGQHYLTVTSHHIEMGASTTGDWTLETNYLVTVAFEEDSETGSAIKQTLVDAFRDIGIGEELLKKITFVTDNGANVVKALEDFVRLYCCAHGINVSLRSAMSVKYHEVID